MPFPQNAPEWLLANRDRIFRWMFLPQLLVAVLFLGFAYKTGRVPYRVLLAGVRAQGTVVGFQPVLFRSNNSFSRTVNMPIIQFRAGDHLVRFREWKSSRSDPRVGSQISVLYDPSDPSSAMMDRGPLNWFPWAPCAAFGLFLALVGLKGLFTLLFASLRTSTAVRPA